MNHSEHHRLRGGPDENVDPKTRRTSAPWGRGYFAFPPDEHGRTSFAFPHILLTQEMQAAHDAEAERQKRGKEEAWEERCRRDAQLRRERLAQEQAEALVGEMDWVRSGFTLRDANGRRDVARTEQLRAEIRLQDEEKRLRVQWDAYEARWRALLASGTPVSFQDVPWPLPTPPSSADDLSHDAIADFLFAPLRARTNTVTRRDRVRASLLRWHPDKVSSVLSRVVPEEADVVREGINTVFRCLKAVQDKERQVQSA